MPKHSDITYAEAMEKVMEANGGFAPLPLLYREIGKYKDMSKMRGKTPDYTIQEKAQRDPRFVRIGLGLYALKSWQDSGRLVTPPPAKTKAEQKVRKHAEIQSKLILIGNHNPEVKDTYTNDKNTAFTGGTLGGIATLNMLPQFTYEKNLKSASFADVVWMNERGYPSHLFEVEHSTKFVNALTKFCDLQNFFAKFICVADETRKPAFERHLERPAFKAMKGRCAFFTYEQVESDYEQRLKGFNIR